MKLPIPIWVLILAAVVASSADAYRTRHAFAEYRRAAAFVCASLLEDCAMRTPARTRCTPIGWSP